jgi:hypothetical protein
MGGNIYIYIIIIIIIILHLFVFLPPVDGRKDEGGPGSSSPLPRIGGFGDPVSGSVSVVRETQSPE